MKTKTIRTDAWHYRIWKGADLFDFSTPKQTDICKYRARFTFNLLIMYPFVYLVGVPFCFTIYYSILTPIAWLFGYKPRLIMFGSRIREPLFACYKKFRIGKLKFYPFYFYPFHIVWLIMIMGFLYGSFYFFNLVLQVERSTATTGQFIILVILALIVWFMVFGMMLSFTPIPKKISKTKIYKSFTETWKLREENLKAKLKAKKEKVCHVVRFEVVRKGGGSNIKARE